VPSQNNQAAQLVSYVEGDTAPPLKACLKDGNGDAVDLTGAGVTISIAFAMPRATYYTSPRNRIVDESPCTFNIDQSLDGGHRGWISWSPSEDDLFPPGQYLYTFEITYQDGSHQTIPADTYMPMKIRTRVGGLGK